MIDQPRNPVELLEGHPFDHLVDADARDRINARAAELLDLDAAVKQVRLACGVAQTAVAAALGVSKSAVAQLEGRPIESIQVGTLNRYFNALGYRLQIELQPIDG